MLNITPADNYFERPKIVSIIGPGFTKKGPPTNVTPKGNEFDQKAVYGDRAQQVQEIKMPLIYRSQKGFQETIMDNAKSFDVNAPKNEYPYAGGFGQEDVSNSNTFVDNVVESSGGEIMDFDRALHQNSGE